MKTTSAVLLTAVVSLGIGLGFNFYQQNKQATENNLEQPRKITKRVDQLPAFEYPDLQGNLRSSNEWGNKVVVLNFWATWCPPCRKEMPDFIEVQNNYHDKVQFVGIAIDDQSQVQSFADEFGINFPTLLGDMTAIELSKQLGNRFSGLPFTAIFDNEGKLQFTRTGELERNDLEIQLRKLL